MNLKLLTTLMLLLFTFVNAMPFTEEEREFQKEAKKLIRYCQPQTPCGWKIYNYIDYPEINFTNDYCVCRPGQKCQFHENRPNEGYIEYRCKY